VYYEGDAGPYHLFVTVRVPQVIPGVAEIQIRCAAKDVRAIQIVPMRLADLARTTRRRPTSPSNRRRTPIFAGSLWLMEDGALKVRVSVDGAKGKGELSVPVAAAAQKTLKDGETAPGITGVPDG